MDDKAFVWSHELVVKLLDLRYENEWLFKKRKQPWKEFHQILLNNGFPDTMTVNHVRKKWCYIYEMFKAAKKEKNKYWPYYEQFEKIFGKTSILDKYNAWSNEWRQNLITCITEAQAANLDFYNFWRTVERALRCQELPLDCCIQDIMGLWQHMRMTFNRKYRIRHRKHKRASISADWPLYDAMLEYYSACDPRHLCRLQTDSVTEQRCRKTSNNYLLKHKDQEGSDEDEFQWNKDITESFIQIRLQNDWLFRERKWAWNDLLAIMREEHGFPKTLTGRDICRKWASTFSDYQKAKATNNKSWVYYNLFELYLGEGSLSLNPLLGWQEEWTSNLISARIDFDHLFRLTNKDRNEGWREVEKRLRSIGLPLDHSLLDLPEIWTHLLKTYRWKQKFARKGILTEHWPFFEALSQYEEIKHQPIIKKQNLDEISFDNDAPCDVVCEDDYEDDMKLFDLKQKLELQVKPKFEYSDGNQCRSCSTEGGCVDIFENVDDNGMNLADKLRVIGDVEVDRTDNLPTQICMECFRELENAYKFRRKCQEVDKVFRTTQSSNMPHEIKIEVPLEYQNSRLHDAGEINDDGNAMDDSDAHFDDTFQDSGIRIIPESRMKPKLQSETKRKPATTTTKKKKRRTRKEKYIYYKICDICGKHTRNLKSHLDTHSDGKSYSCEVCDKKFKFKSGLIVHKASHEPTPRKKCDVCGKTFHILAQYRRHYVYHANERKFECETCGKRFNTLEILRVHSRSHTDERPYSCSECGKTFRTAGCVSRHKRIVHRTAKTIVQ